MLLKLKINLKSFHIRNLILSIKRFFLLSKELGVKSFHVKMLKNRIIKFTLLKSPFIYKNARDQYKMQFYTAQIVIKFKICNQFKLYLYSNFLNVFFKKRSFFNSSSVSFSKSIVK